MLISLCRPHVEYFDKSKNENLWPFVTLRYRIWQILPFIICIISKNVRWNCRIGTTRTLQKTQENHSAGSNLGISHFIFWDLLKRITKGDINFPPIHFYSIFLWSILDFFPIFFPFPIDNAYKKVSSFHRMKNFNKDYTIIFLLWLNLNGFGLNDDGEKRKKRTIKFM